MSARAALGAVLLGVVLAVMPADHEPAPPSATHQQQADPNAGPPGSKG